MMPPDESNLRYLFRADMGVFQNISGTTPATNDTEVKLWKDNLYNVAKV